MLREEEYETMQAETTTQEKMQKLFSYSQSWIRACKDQVYHALKEMYSYLIMELFEKSISVSDILMTEG